MYSVRTLWEKEGHSHAWKILTDESNLLLRFLELEEIFESCDLDNWIVTAIKLSSLAYLQLEINLENGRSRQHFLA